MDTIIALLGTALSICLVYCVWLIRKKSHKLREKFTVTINKNVK